VEYRNRTFKNEDVLLDGNALLGCSIIECRLIVRAEAPWVLKGNLIMDVEWVFEGPALLTLQILRTLYHASDTRKVVEDLLESIRRPG
jgi:hypothetical protein